MFQILGLTLTIATVVGTAHSLRVPAQNAPAAKGPTGGCWQKKYDDASVLDVSADDNLVYVSRAGGRIQALSAATGEVVWSAELGGVPVSPPVPTPTGPAVLTARPLTADQPGSGDLRLLSSQTGVTLWLLQLPASPTSSLYLAGKTLISLDGYGAIDAYEAASGRKVWSAALGKAMTASILVGQNRLVVGTSDGMLVLISAEDGRILGVRPLGMAATALSGFPDGPIVVGDAGGRIFAVEFGQRRVKWDLRNGARISSFAAPGDSVIATSFDNFVYALTSSGNIRWKRRLSGRLTGAPAVGDTVVVVPAANEGTAYAIEVKSGKLVDRLNMYGEGADSKMSVARISGDRFVLADSDTVRAYGVATCTVNEKKQP